MSRFDASNLPFRLIGMTIADLENEINNIDNYEYADISSDNDSYDGDETNSDNEDELNEILIETILP